MTWLGWFHVGSAAAGLVTGLLVAMARKGTRHHRRMGWAYIVSMLAVNLSALLIYRLLGHFGPFHAAALFSLASIGFGAVPAIRRAPRGRWLSIHAYWMSGSYVGLWAAAVAETTTRTEIFPFWWAVLAATAAVSAIGIVTILTRVPVAFARLKDRYN